MNYFAHLHLAHLTKTSLTGNLLGDFVKGSDLSRYPKDIALGIRLHRKIDSFTDAHPICTQFKQDNKAIRRYAGIGLDILFDHLLYRMLGDKYHEHTHQFYQILSEERSRLSHVLPDNYTQRLSSIIQHDWFGTYTKIEGIEMALTRTASRFQHPVELVLVIDWYLQHQAEVDVAFQKLYSDTIEYAQTTKLVLSQIDS